MNNSKDFFKILSCSNIVSVLSLCALRQPARPSFGGKNTVGKHRKQKSVQKFPAYSLFEDMGPEKTDKRAGIADK
jgi:hypothetical protein